MSTEKDELISASELARRIKVDPSFISKRKEKLKSGKCTHGKKFYYRKSCLLLGKDPDNPHESRQSAVQKNKSEDSWTVYSDPEEGMDAIADKLGIKKNKPKPKPEPKQKPQSKPKEPTPLEEDNNNFDDEKSEARELLDQILKVVKNPKMTTNMAELNGLKTKAAILTEYFKGESEEIKSRKLKENLFDRDEVMQILSFSMNMVRNSLINMKNNYAVNLEGLSSQEIKEYVEDDTNRILEDLQKVGDQFNE